MPGVRINLSKTGSSLSLGRRGSTLNFSSRGTKATVGLPGSGLSYSTMLQSGPPTALPGSPPRSTGPWIALVIFVGIAAVVLIGTLHG